MSVEALLNKETDLNKKISDLINKMTLEEKASFCSGKDFWHLEGLESLGIPSIMVTDGPHGLRKQDGSAGDHIGLKASVPATCYPTAVTMASSWDRDLLREMGETLGDECRQEQVSVLLGPGVNIKRNPLCGRNFEYFSEDPYISGELGASFINGVQSKGIGTSLKHYAANNQEFCRMTIDTIVDERTLREIYLRGFETAVKDGQPWTVMNAYNKVNGEYCCEHKSLLTDILKEEWGHEGLVVTDWGATNDRVDSLKAGMELEMPASNGVNDKKIIDAVNNGTLDESVLDKSLKRILTMIFRSEETLKETYTYDIDEHHLLAKKSASQSIVLLKNDNKLLPLEKKGKIAFIGDFAENPRYQGTGSSQINPTRIDSALDYAKSTLGNDCEILYAQGFSTKKDIIDNSLEKEALKIAETADRTVLFVGLPPTFESEGFDRDHMRLPENQLNLIDRVLETDPDTIIVLSNGSPVEMPFIKNSKAILESYLSGQAGGGAVIDILFGDIVPSGKIAETFPLSLNDIPSNSYFPGTTKQVEYREGLNVGYRYFDTLEKDVLFPFGHGLSYTDFSYSDVKLSASKIKSGETVSVSLKVKNIGDFDGKEIVQLYVKDSVSSVYRPEKELKGFKKVELRKGEEKEISFTLDKRSFAFFDRDSAQWQIESGDFKILLGASSRDIRQEETIFVQSDFTPKISESDKYFKELKDIHNIDNSAFEKLLGRRIPVPAPIRPFHTNSTIGDISGTFIGKQVKKQVVLNMQKMFGGADENILKMVNRMIDEMPLRSLGIMGGDDFPPHKMEGLLYMLNGKFFKGMKRFRGK